MRVLVTGANGFIGKNLVAHLQEIRNYEVLTFIRGQSKHVLQDLLSKADAVVHLAGENRPSNKKAFEEVNVILTQDLCKSLKSLEKKIQIRSRKTKGTTPLDKRINCINKLLEEYPELSFNTIIYES
jgi:UDP-2-acetamido-2,6-beta-L-arabino-hexul-4-ose reductase